MKFLLSFTRTAQLPLLSAKRGKRFKQDKAVLSCALFTLLNGRRRNAESADARQAQLFEPTMRQNAAGGSSRDLRGTISLLLSTVLGYGLIVCQ